MRGNPHVRFGGRAEETDRLKSPHRASARPNHTHASHLLKAGVNIKIVSRRLGHASVSFTLDKYSHLMPDDDQQAAVAVANLVDATVQ